jgi:hypothetical protein
MMIMITGLLTAHRVMMNIGKNFNIGVLERGMTTVSVEYFALAWNSMDPLYRISRLVTIVI